MLPEAGELLEAASSIQASLARSLPRGLKVPLITSEAEVRCYMRLSCILSCLDWTWDALWLAAQPLISSEAVCVCVCVCEHTRVHAERNLPEYKLLRSWT